MGRPLVRPASRDDGLNAPPGQPGTQGVAVIARIGNQPLGPFPGSPGCARPRSPRHRPAPSPACPCPARSPRAWLPCGRRDTGAGTAYAPAPLLPVVERGQTGASGRAQLAARSPNLEPARARAGAACRGGDAPLGTGPADGLPLSRGEPSWRYVSHSSLAWRGMALGHRNRSALT
jgi:hypothetical protein